jgi:hypothetical protein
LRLHTRPDGCIVRALLLVLTVLAGGAPAHATLADSPAADGCATPPPALEASGARVGKILVRNHNIFDLSDPKEDKDLFRLMNRLHVQTRSSVIKQQLLVETGDPYRRKLLDESERILRATAYLHDAQITEHACDGESVDILVETRDVWTLKPGISLSRSGGETRTSFDIQEDNFLGRGGSIRLLRRSDAERRTWETGYSAPNLGGRWIALDATVAHLSDGHVLDFGLARPFYSLDARWAAGMRVLDERREDPVYALGDEIGRFRHDMDHYEAFGGWSGGLVDGWVERWLAGVVYDNRRFDEVADSPELGLLPAPRRLVYPFIEYQLLEDAYLRAENLDQIQRTEDVALGLQLWLRLGVLTPALGADRGGAIFSALAGRGFGDPFRTLWHYSVHAQGRLEGGGLNNVLIGGSTRWYLRQSERRLLFASVRGDIAEDLDLDNPLEIGGDDGLRGYPLRYQRGTARAQFTIEQRYFTDYYLWRLFRVGGAVFFDAGRVWGANPFGGENLGLLKDVGFGLRLASTRSSIGRMVHVDFAFPLDGDPSIDRFQFLIEGKRSF